MKSFVLLFLSIAALAPLLFTGCGQGHKETSTDGVRTVTLTANDSMKFSLSDIQAAPGERLRLVLHNVGRMPKHTMGHNWVLFQSMEASAFNRIGMEAARNAPDYLPADRSVILAKTKMLGPGESDTITFTVPEETGDYPFACTFPGHFALMRGKVTVR